MSETEIFQPLKLFQNYFSNIEHVRKYSWAPKATEIILGNFPRAEIKLFQADVDEGWNNFISCVTMAQEKLHSKEVINAWILLMNTQSKVS